MTFSGISSPPPPPELLREKITQLFESKIFALNKDEPTYKSWKKYYERQMEEELDAVDFYEKNKKVKGRKFKNIDENITHSLHLRKTNMTVEFNDKESASIKSFAVKKKKRNKSSHTV